MMHPALWLIGYYEISVPEAYAARFVELSEELDIDFGDGGIERACARRVFLVSARLAGKFLRACAAAGIDATVRKKRGAPILLLKLLRRPGIALGLLLFAALAFFSQRVIWRIEVVGNDTLEYAEVCELLSEQGVRPGVLKSSLDVDKITNRLLISTDKVSWMSINVVGTLATVEIREALPPPATDPPVCSNVVAAENGVIVSFDNVRGNLAVGVGDAVAKGDLLVGGVYGAEGEAVRFVRATGSVFARVSRELELDIPLAYTQKVYTGRQKVQKSLIFFEKEVKFFGNSGNSYATCDTIDKVEYFNFFGLGNLPIGIRTVTYLEYENCDSILSKGAARAEAKRALWERFASVSSNAELVSSKIEITVEENVCRVRARIESIENIAREIAVEINITG